MEKSIACEGVDITIDPRGRLCDCPLRLLINGGGTTGRPSEEKLARAIDMVCQTYRKRYEALSDRRGTLVEERISKRAKENDLFFTVGVLFGMKESGKSADSMRRLGTILMDRRV